MPSGMDNLEILWNAFAKLWHACALSNSRVADISYSLDSNYYLIHVMDKHDILLN